MKLRGDYLCPNLHYIEISGFLLKDIDPESTVYKGTVAPAYGQPGGAEEILLKIPIPVVSVFDMQSKKTLYSYLK